MLRRNRLRGAASVIPDNLGNRFPITRFCSKALQNYKKKSNLANISGSTNHLL